MERDETFDPTEWDTNARTVARLFDVSGTTVTNWVRSGKLPARRLPGGAYRFRRVDVEKLLRPVTAGA